MTTFLKSCLLTLCFACTVLMHARTPLEHYSPAIRGVEASSVLDAAVFGPGNVTDWNWTSRWRPKEEGAGARVRLNFLGEVPVGGVNLVDEANERGTVEAVRLLSLGICFGGGP